MGYAINRVEVLLPIVHLAIIAPMDVATGADYGSKPDETASFSQILSSKIVVASDAVEQKQFLNSLFFINYLVINLRIPFSIFYFLYKKLLLI
jgi:hypothetical protein